MLGYNVQQGFAILAFIGQPGTNGFKPFQHIRSKAIILLPSRQVLAIVLEQQFQC